MVLKEKIIAKKYFLNGIINRKYANIKEILKFLKKNLLWTNRL